MTTTSVATLAELKTALAAAATNGQADIITLTADISAVDGADFTAGTGGRDLVKVAITDGQTLSIVGGGFALDANYFGRVLEVSSGTVAISNLTLREGGLSGDGGEGQGIGGGALGAGIYNSANLTLSNVSVTLNAASGGGGGYGGGYGGGGGGGGGAGSVAGHGGGGAAAPGYAASGGTGGAGGQGAYYPTTFGGGGSSQGGAGGVYGSAHAGDGGAAQAGTLSVGGGGGGAGGGVISGDGGVGGAAVGGIYNSASGVLWISGGAITGNVGAGGGGGATASSGRDSNGGVAVGGLLNAGYLTLDNVTLSGNAAGGGLSAVDGHIVSYADSHSTGVVNSAPTGSVGISGTSAQGQVLTASNTLADADGLGTINYQWKSDGAVISGATAATFTLTQAQVGHAVTVAAGYTDGSSHAESVTSSGTASVANLNDAPTGAVAIAGTATQGQTLTASNTLADPDGLGTISYQWQSDGASISGATAATFTLTQAQVGHVVTVAAGYTDGFSHAESITSSGTASVANVNDAPTGSVSIAGTATQGQTLTASNTLADPDGLGTISYQWQSDGAAISGATSATFTLTQAQVGHAVTVVASYTDGFSHAETVASASVTPTAPAPPPEPEPEPEPPAPTVVTVVTAGGNSVTGGAQANVIASSGGADTVSAGAGDDTVVGGARNDVLQGNQDQDSIAGGGGDDLIHGGQGDDALQGDSGRDVLFGDKGADRVLGGEGGDLMQGGQGGDYLSGDAGDDVVRGGQGDDRVFGGDGSDFLSGDRGNDTLTGGAGADTFYSFGDAGIDLISDFNRAEGDHIQLEAGTIYTVSQIGADVHIDMTGGAEIILAGLQLSSLTGDWIVV